MLTLTPQSLRLGDLIVIEEPRMWHSLHGTTIGIIVRELDHSPHRRPARVCVNGKHHSIDGDSLKGLYLVSRMNDR